MGYIYCLDDPTKLQIRGNGLTTTHQNLLVKVAKCSPEKVKFPNDDCIDEVLINQALANSYLVLLSNEITFNAKKFGTESVTK